MWGHLNAPTFIIKGVYYKMSNLILKKTKINYYFKVGILFFLIILIVSCCYTLLNAKICSIFLVIEDSVKGEILYSKQVKSGDIFVYEYTHSLEKLPVHETFMVAENLDIILTKTRLKFLSGSGDFPAPEEKINFTKKDEIIIESERHFSSLSLRVAYFYKQQIIFGEEKIEISQLTSKGNLIKIFLEKRGDNK